VCDKVGTLVTCSQPQGELPVQPYGVRRATVKYPILTVGIPLVKESRPTRMGAQAPPRVSPPGGRIGPEARQEATVCPALSGLELAEAAPYNVWASGGSAAWLARPACGGEVGVRKGGLDGRAESTLPHFVYILQSESNGSYYVGTTSCMRSRLAHHNSGATTYTRTRRPWKIVYYEEYGTGREGRYRERQIKRRKSRKYIDELISLRPYGERTTS